MDLGGRWLAAVADEELRRTFAEPGADDGAWDEIEVPSAWPAGTAGPMLYRRSFSAPAPIPGTRAWLVFDGLVSQGDVWLDGAYLCDTDGDHIRHTFEITEQLRAGRDHLLAVEVAADADQGGLLHPVHVDHTGPVRARSLRVLCREATETQAVLALRAELDSDEHRTITVRTAVGEHSSSSEHSVAVGSNFVEWTFTVPQPQRWWPHTMGEQPMHDLVVEVAVDGIRSHTVQRRVGLRSVAMKNGVLTVNGERLFVKGAAAVSPEHARDAGLDLVRLDRLADHDVYRAADELGVLVWQELPNRGSRKQTARQIGGAVDYLGHHPSVAILSGGRAVRRAAEKADPTRPCLAPTWPPVDDPVALARLIPRVVRFVQDLDGGTEPRRRIEVLRRIKYRPTGGFCLTSDVTFDVVDACRPVIVVADELPDAVAPGETLALDVHVVSDLRAPIDAARVEAVLGWSGGSYEWRWEGDIPADECVRVGTLQAVVPDEPGQLTLDVTLHAGDHVATYGDAAPVVSSRPRDPG